MPVAKLWLTEKVKVSIERDKKTIEVLEKTVKGLDKTLVVLDKLEQQASENLNLDRDTNGVVKHIRNDVNKLRKDLGE